MATILYTRHSRCAGVQWLSISTIFTFIPPISSKSQYKYEKYTLELRQLYCHHNQKKKHRCRPKLQAGHALQSAFIVHQPWYPYIVVGGQALGERFHDTHEGIPSPAA